MVNSFNKNNSLFPCRYFQGKISQKKSHQADIFLPLLHFYRFSTSLLSSHRNKETQCIFLFSKYRNKNDVRSPNNVLVTLFYSSTTIKLISAQELIKFCSTSSAFHISTNKNPSNIFNYHFIHQCHKTFFPFTISLSFF